MNSVLKEYRLRALKELHSLGICRWKGDVIGGLSYLDVFEMAEEWQNTLDNIPEGDSGYKSKIPQHLRYFYEVYNKGEV